MYEMKTVKLPPALFISTIRAGVQKTAKKQRKRLQWPEFLRALLELHAAGFVCGSDFRFGFRGEGNGRKLADFCKERELPCSIVPEQLLDGIRISSTHIRTLLETGQMEQALHFLGHPHILTGTVVPGRHLGRTIGIPTANLQLPEGVVSLRKGVYACKARVEGQTYLAVTNVGSRPTVGGHVVTVEPWLLDFEGDLYGKELSLELYAFLRPERRFADLSDLRNEILRNGEQTRSFFESK